MKTRQKILLFFEALLSCLAFFTADHVITHEEVLEGLKHMSFFAYEFHKLEINYAAAYGIKASIFFLLLLFFYSQIHKSIDKKDKRMNVIATICGMLFSIMVVVGHTYDCSNSLDLIFYSKSQIVISIINLAGYFFLFKNLFICLITWTKKKKIFDKEKVVEQKNKVLACFDKHPMISCFAILLICWIPYILCFYPGTMNYDALEEINQFFGKMNWNTHHPIIPTIIYGNFMKLGQSLSNDNLGLFFNNICQVLIGGLVISYSIYTIYEITRSKKIRNILMCFFALFPIFPLNLYTEVKDTGFFIGVLLYIVMLIRMIHTDGKMSKKEWSLFIISVLITCFFRNNGVYLILLTTPFLFGLKNKKERIKIIVISILLVLICHVTNSLLMKKLDIEKGSIREAMAIPLQQTARYITMYDLTEEEKQDIEKIVEVKVAKELYNPDTVDYIKIRFKADGDTEAIKNYLIRWIKMFFKHPDVYINATLNSTYGYFYPDKKEHNGEIVQFDLEQFNINLMNLQLQQANYSLKYDIEYGVYMVRKLPLIGLLISSCGFYNWLLLITTLILIYYKKLREIIPLIPLYVVWLVCIASPVDAYLRYMLPTIVSMPFIISWTYHVITDRVKETNHKEYEKSYKAEEGRVENG